jgi:hypothetical protein
MKLHSLLVAIGLLLASSISAGELAKTSGSRPSVRLEVEGHGRNFDDAKRNGFRSAIEQAVGSFLISDVEVNGDRVTKDFIGDYSAGYVDSYEVISSGQEADGTYVVHMNVAVASSKIAQRMIASGNQQLINNGLQLQAQIETQLDPRNRGDAIIAEVLSSYPEKSFIVNSGQTEFKIGRTRSAYLEIPYQLEMSQFWLESLSEALTTVAADNANCSTLTMALTDSIKQGRVGNATKRLADKPCGGAADMRVFFKKSNDVFPRAYSYYFYDAKTLHSINRQLQPPRGEQHIGLRVELVDSGGTTLDSVCTRVNTDAFIRYSDPNLASYELNYRSLDHRPDIVGQNKTSGVIRINIANINNVGDLAKVKITVEKTCN